MEISVIKKVIHHRKVGGRYVRNKLTEAGLSLDLLQKSEDELQQSYDDAIKYWNSYKGAKGRRVRCSFQDDLMHL